MNRSYPLLALLTGKRVAYGPQGQPSAIAKARVEHELQLDKLGLLGDEQGDTKRHGGEEKAVHHYAYDHYPYWERALGLAAGHLAIGAFGENFATLGLDESHVCVGDVWAVGSALVQVSQGRQPCWKLNLRFAARQMARWVQDSGKTGWYYRVVEPGSVAAGDTLRLLHRPRPLWPIQRLQRALYRDVLNRAELELMTELRELAPSWRDIARRRLDHGTVEDFSPRLNAPS